MIRRLSISPEFVMRMGPNALVLITQNPVPADAKIVGRGYDREADVFYVDIDSFGFGDDTPLDPAMRRIDPTNLEDREILRRTLADGVHG